MDATTSWSRRSVLVAAAAGAGAAVLASPLGAIASAAETTSEGAVGLRRGHWTKLMGKKVDVDSPTGRVRATVVGVEDLLGAPVGDPRRFSVELRTDSGPAVAGLCPVTLPGRGVATLLLSAVDRGDVHRSSQIVVNNPPR